MVGNFPQAISHVALINSALNLGAVEKPARQRAESDAETMQSEEQPAPVSSG
jgi:hypothetical protein